MAQSAQTEMSWEDQQTLNKFAVENTRKNSIKEEIMLNSEELDTLKYLEQELELDLEDTVLYRYGEVYIPIDKEEAIKQITERSNSINQKIDSLRIELEKTEDDIIQYKAELYGKFGHDKINLED